MTTPMTCSLPPHREQWLISMLKTRFSRESQVIGALGGSKVWPFYSVLGTRYCGLHGHHEMTMSGVGSEQASFPWPSAG